MATYGELDGDDQAAMQTAAVAFEFKRWAAGQEDQLKNPVKPAEAGATIVILSDQKLAAAVNKIRADVRPEVIGELGEELAALIFEAAAN